MRKILFCIVSMTVIIVILCSSVICSAESTIPYANYTFSEKTGEAMQAPQAYVPERIVYALNIGVSEFKDLSDIFYHNDGLIYLLDSGNNRVVVVDNDFTLLKSFSCIFSNENGDEVKLNGASGLFVDKNYIYIADSKNARVLIINRYSGEYVKEILTPKSVAFDDDFIFKPIRIAVDDTGLLYIVSEGTYEGVLNLDADGNFIGFFGSNTATTSAWDLFWRNFSTKEQRKAMVQLIPQDFSSITMDSHGFFLTTVYTQKDKTMVKRLNPGGNNVIRNLSKVGIVGDPNTVWSGSLSGSSTFVDIASGIDNIYACLDTTRGRVFCYDNDGYMIYTFGTLSDQLGGFSTPSSLTYINDNKIAVVDTQNCSITVFKTTDYGEAVNSALHYTSNLETDNATKAWKNVLSLNNNMDMAHNALGQAYMNDFEYKTAMKEFYAANNKTMYSKAYKQYQSQWIYKNIYIILIAIMAFIAIVNLILLIKKYLAKRKKNGWGGNPNEGANK